MPGSQLNDLSAFQVERWSKDRMSPMHITLKVGVNSVDEHHVTRNNFL